MNDEFPDVWSMAEGNEDIDPLENLIADYESGKMRVPTPPGYDPTAPQQAKGRRRGCKAKGLKGKAFRECVRDLRAEDKGRTKSEVNEKKKDRVVRYKEAVAEGTVQRTFFGKVFKGIKKFGLAPARNAFNLLIRANAWDFASKLAKLKAMSASDPKAKRAYNKSLAAWIQTGGSRKVFEKMISKGKDKPKLRLPFMPKKGADGGYSNVTGFETFALTATPLIVAVGAVLGSVKSLVGSTDMSNEDKLAVAKEFSQHAPAYIIDQEQEEESQDRDEMDNDLIPGVPNSVTYTGIAIAGAATVFLIVSALSKGKK